MLVPSTAELLFVGIVAKRVAARPDWLESDVVTEICSVSDHIADRVTPGRGPNAFGLHDRRESALSSVRLGDHDYELFAYRVWPVEFDETGERDLVVVDSCAAGLVEEPELSRWERIGYDVVATDDEVQASWCWCSPLSCNSAATDHTTNRLCLIDEFDDAIALAREFADIASAVEPGPYLVVEVLRDVPPELSTPSH